MYLRPSLKYSAETLNTRVSLVYFSCLDGLLEKTQRGVDLGEAKGYAELRDFAQLRWVLA